MPTVYVDSPPPTLLDQIKSTRRHWSWSPRMPIRLFPIVQWLPKYNWIWLSGDLICAITVGAIIVPQAMAYAKLAGMPPQFGLYSSFVGAALYPFLGTSKDISIGPTAITSLLVGQIVASLKHAPEFLSGEWSHQDFAVTLALFAGFVCAAIAMLRLGILFRFICQPAIAGFMAGSGLTIVINQIPKILGINGIPSSDPPYLMFGKTIANLHHTRIDAVFGLLSLVWLYGVRSLSQYLTRRYPQHARALFFFSITRNVVVIVLTTLLSYLINHLNHFDNSPFHILGAVPSGFQMMGVPKIKANLVTHIMPDIPSVVTLLVMEHCAIAVGLGKATDYRIDVNQEILTIGLSNIFGAFFTAYPAGGSFSRSAVASKSGAKTPLTHTFVAIIVVLALYVFTPAFEYIPSASLAAVIAHAVTDLIVGPKVWQQFWKLHPSELLIFASAYIIALFTRIDVSVYVPVALSLIIQLYRIATPSYAFLGRIDLDAMPSPMSPMACPPKEITKEAAEQQQQSLDRAMFFSFSHPILGRFVRPIGPGFLCFQPRENLVFENASLLLEKLMDEIKRTTRRGTPLSDKVGDRPWNDAVVVKESDTKPLLQAIILDLSSVHQMDYSAMEELRELAMLVDRYAGHMVSWYMVINDTMAVRKGLLMAGFGQQRRRKGVTGPFVSDLDVPLASGTDPRGDAPANASSITDSPIMTKTEDEVIVIESVVSQTQPSADSPDTSLPSTDKTFMDTLSISNLADRYPYLFLSLQDAVHAALQNHASPVIPPTTINHTVD